MRRREHDGVDRGILEHRRERADGFETVLCGEIAHPRGIAADGMRKAQLLALALHRIDQGLAPAAEPYDCRADHRFSWAERLWCRELNTAGRRTGGWE